MALILFSPVNAHLVLYALLGGLKNRLAVKLLLSLQGRRNFAQGFLFPTLMLVLGLQYCSLSTAASESADDPQTNGDNQVAEGPLPLDQAAFHEQLITRASIACTAKLITDLLIWVMQSGCQRCGSSAADSQTPQSEQARDRPPISEDNAAQLEGGSPTHV